MACYNILQKVGIINTNIKNNPKFVYEKSVNIENVFLQKIKR